MIALLCAMLLCLNAGDSTVRFPLHGASRAGEVLKFDKDGVGYWAPVDPRWNFTLHFYGRAIVVDGWESERECREMKDRMRRQYPDARITECEESR